MFCCARNRKKKNTTVTILKFDIKLTGKFDYNQSCSSFFLKGQLNLFIVRKV